MTLTEMTRLPTEQEEAIEEALSEIFECIETKLDNESHIRSHVDKKIQPGLFDDLIKQDFIRAAQGTVQFEDKGQKIAARVIRRKRLAERLLKDVLNVRDEHIDPAACQWEHILSKEVTDSICTLLGHPSHSPHDMAIPPGECCRQKITAIDPVICSLDKLSGGQRGKITYLLFKNNPQLQQLLSLGLTPGTPVNVIQKFPTFIVEVNESQLAFDEEIAKSIYVHPLS